MEKNKRGAVAMSEIAKAYVQIEPTFNGVQAKIEQEMGSEGEKGGSKFGAGFAKVLGGAGQVVAGAAKLTAGAVAAGSVAVAGLVKSATESYGEYEQLVGGVETLFGNNYNSVEEYAAGVGLSLEEAGATWEQYQARQQTVLDNAANAYQTAGMSTNEYMSTVTSFAAALNSSLGEYAWQSANYADMAIGDMADNANKMGTSMEAVQNAYMGFSKGQFNMLDNLKLGYGGTKTEMEKLMRDAEQMEGYVEGSLSIDSFADVVEAIHIVQENMGITGTTAKEASSTIQGSLATLKSSWENVITGMGDKDADLSGLIDNLIQSAQTFIGNLIPIIEQALQGVSSMIAQLAPVIAQELPGLLQSVLPMLMTAGADIIQTLAEGILAAVPELLPSITDLIISLSQMLIEMLPQLIEVGAQVILSLATGIAEALPELVPTIVQVVVDICMYLLENIDLLIDAAAQLMIGLAEGIVAALPILIEKAPIILLKLAEALFKASLKLYEVAEEIIKVIKEGIDQYLPGLLAKGAEAMTKLKQKITDKVKEFTQIGKMLVEGIKKGISDAWEALQNWFGEKISGLVGGVKDLLGIESPSKVFANEVGKMIPLGIAEGIADEMGVVDDTVKAMTTGMVDMGVSASVTQQVTAGAMQSDPLAAIVSLLSSYLPVIASGENQHVYLEGDAGRLFRVIQRESIRNTQIVGTNSVLSATT